MTLGNVPAPALWLGLAGLLPFVLMTLGLWGTGDPRWAAFLLFAQVIYAALAASFLGAVHWGLAMANLRRVGGSAPGAVPPESVTRQFLSSVAPALAAWSIVLVSQILRTGWVELLMLMALFAAIHAADRRAVRTGLAPGWYLDLRLPTTLGIEAALALSLLRLFAGGTG